MTTRLPARTPLRPLLRIVVAGLLALDATIAVARGSQSLSPWSSTMAASPSSAASAGPSTAHTAAAPVGVLRPARPAALGLADGVVPDGTTVFDDAIPGVGNLDPALLGALRKAAIAAAKNGVELDVRSGWRSRAYQEQLLLEAISKYGSEREAARWVGTPDTSAHVAGKAVDIAPTAAIAWLSRYGARYGLCQIYRNEPWHFELRPAAIADGCPRMYSDPTHDPRMEP